MFAEQEKAAEEAASAKKKTKELAEVDIFGDTGDIFADVPSGKGKLPAAGGAKKTKKKKAGAGKGKKSAARPDEAPGNIQYFSPFT